MKKMKLKVEELLEREPSEENCPRVLYRGDWLQRSGYRCSRLVPKYAQRVCRQLGELSVKGDDLLEQIKPILKRCLQGLSWWDKMKDPKENWGTSKKAKKRLPLVLRWRILYITSQQLLKMRQSYVYSAKNLYRIEMRHFGYHERC